MGCRRLGSAHSQSIWLNASPHLNVKNLLIVSASVQARKAAKRIGKSVICVKSRSRMSEVAIPSTAICEMQIAKRLLFLQTYLA